MMTRITPLLLMLLALQPLTRTQAQESPKVGPTDGGGGSVYGPITYDPSGNIIGVGTDTGVASSYFYDPMGRLVTANVQKAGYTQSHSYTYDPYGNRTSVTGASTTTYSVDATTNRLGSGTPHHAQGCRVGSSLLSSLDSRWPSAISRSERGRSSRIDRQGAWFTPAASKEAGIVR